ncbi:MAG TPA: S-layer homology domain-containing protein [Chloroflexia bacterium]|nr:S-layer homology domain-containing protein [Chloroflexia bacterium]
MPHNRRPGRAPAILFFTLLACCIAALALAIPFSATADDFGFRISDFGLHKSEKPSPSSSVTDSPSGKSEIRNPKWPSAQIPDRAGGPDEFGYFFADDREVGGPLPVTDGNWQPGVNRVGDDAWVSPRGYFDPLDDGVITTTLPFSFTFYGVNYGAMHIATNGNAHFGPPNDWYPGASNACLPSANQFMPKALLAPLYQDFIVPDDTEPGGVYTNVVGVVPNRSYIVEWREVADYSNPDALATFALILQEDGEIYFRYRYLTDADVDGREGVIGIQNPSGFIGLSYSCYEEAIVPSRAIRFRTQDAVIFSPTEAEKGGAPATTLVYYHTLRNQTGITNSFTITPSGNVWTTTVEPEDTGSVPRGATVPISVSVQIPPDATLGDMDVATITVSSVLTTPGQFTATAVLTSSVSSFGVDFFPTEDVGSGDYGTPVTYTTLLYNSTGQDNSFILQMADNDWPTTVTPTHTEVLAPDDAALITVTVYVPAGSALGDRDEMTLTAEGQEPEPGFYFGITRFTTYAGAWARKSLLPTPRSRGAAVSFRANGRIYALGGEYNNGNTNMPILEYDPIADSWTSRANLAVGVSNVGAAVIGDAIYVPGGYSSSAGRAQSLLQVYYPLEDRVEVVATDPLPVPRLGAGVASLDGKLYVMGGSDDSLVPTDTLYEYDPSRPAGSRWELKSPMPTERLYLGAAALNDKIYAVGGVDVDLADLATLEAYDPATDSWSSRQPMILGRGGPAVIGVDSSEVGCGGYLYALGGGWSVYTNSAERYDPSIDSWEPISPLVLGRRSLAAAYSTSTYSLVAFGGWLGSYDSTTEAVSCGGGLVLPTPTPTLIPTATTIPTATPIPTACTLSFSDVPEGSTFYPYVRCLACRGIVSGYSDGTFHPNDDITRGQLAKIVSNAAGFADTPPGQVYEDVPTDNTFYVWIGRLTSRGVMSGYPCGTIPQEPCIAPDNRPYFRPDSNATRGQIAKIVSNAAGFGGTPLQQTFEDVLSSSTFYLWIERLASAGVMGGYPCGTMPGEPCVPPDNRPYFRPNNNATRGQVSKIVSGAFFPNCETPVR